MRTLTIRPSTVGSYMLCPARPGLRGVEDYNYTPNEPLLFGSTVHWIIEYRIEHGAFPSLGMVTTEMFLIFEKDVPADKDATVLSTVTTKAQRSEIASNAMMAALKWETEVLPQLPDEEPVIEQRLVASAGFSADGETEVMVAGTPDAVYPEAGLIVDWKTAGKDWNKDKAASQIQPTAYPWMWNTEQRKLDDGAEVSRFDFWVFDRAAGWWVLHKGTVGDANATLAFKQMAVTAAIAIEDGQLAYRPAGGGFKPRGWHCSPRFCDAWGVCMGKHLVTDGLAIEPALTTKERWQR